MTILLRLVHQVTDTDGLTRYAGAVGTDPAAPTWAGQVATREPREQARRHLAAVLRQVADALESA